MKPIVTKLSSVPLTALLCCPHCTRMISYERGKHSVACHACGATVVAPAMKATGSPVHQK